MEELEELEEIKLRFRLETDWAFWKWERNGKNKKKRRGLEQEVRLG